LDANEPKNTKRKNLEFATQKKIARDLRTCYVRTEKSNFHDCMMMLPAGWTSSGLCFSLASEHKKKTFLGS